MTRHASAHTQEHHNAGSFSYALRNLPAFMASLRKGPGDPDGDNLPRKLVAGPGWECASRSFHSREEAMQFFIGECVTGPGLRQMVWRGMTDRDVFQVAADLHEQCQALDSPIRAASIRSCLYHLIEREGLLERS